MAMNYNQARDEIAKKLTYTYDESQELKKTQVGRYTRFYTVNPVKVMHGDDEYKVVYYKQKKGVAVVIEKINDIFIDHKQYTKKNILEEACRLEVAKVIISIEHVQQKAKIEELMALLNSTN
jgi:hypothetical protein